MNWGEIQLESLKKMFLNNEEISIEKLEEYKNDKKYKTYLYAMPQACNEAINYMLENGRPLIKSYKIKYKDINYKYNLKQIIPNFKRLDQVTYDGHISPDWYVEGDNVLVVRDWREPKEIITIYYESHHDLLTSRTKNNYTFDIDNQLISLIPLYIAGELYKDDDVQLSTIYMNEFMTSISNLKGKDFSPTPNQIETIYNYEMW